MEPAVAATAISGLSSVNDMVALLIKMPSETAAAIVSNMEAKLATKVLSEMMK
jgi:flagellar motility protein MotE (MotC chaperone)